MPSKQVIWVEVTAALIAEARAKMIWRGRSVQCPVALALYTATGRLWSVDCHYAIDLEVSPYQKRPLPDEVTAFVRGFDSNREVEPIRFSLELA